MSSRIVEFLKAATHKVIKVASFRLRNTYAVDSDDTLSILIYPSCYETELRPRQESLVFLLLPPATLIDPRHLTLLHSCGHLATEFLTYHQRSPHLLLATTTFHCYLDTNNLNFQQAPYTRISTMANQDVAALNHLPNEVLRNICKHCRSSDLAHLSLTSSSLKAIANAVLYEDIDLAIHNDAQTGYSARKPYYSDYEPQVLSKTATAQNLFLRNLYENRNRKTITKQATSLSWTFLFFNLNRADCVDHRNYILAPKGGRNPEKTIWTVFKTLKHTKKIDLAILYVNKPNNSGFLQISIPFQALYSPQLRP